VFFLQRMSPGMALRCIRGPAIFWQLSDQQRTSQDFSPS
jgi:hypothetical protein